MILAGKFEDLNKYINTVLIKLLESQNFCKNVYYLHATPTSGEDIDDTYILLFDSIFPYPFTPDTTEKEKVIINVFFDRFIISNSNPYFKDASLVFIILCSTGTCWKIDSGVRPISIMHEIDTIFNKQRIIGLGEMESLTSDIYVANQKFVGYMMKYKFVDFN